MPESLLLPLPCQPTPSLVLYDCAWPEGPQGASGITLGGCLPGREALGLTPVPTFVPSHVHSGQPPFPVLTPSILAASPLSTSLCHSPCVSGGLFSYPFACAPAAPPSSRVCGGEARSSVRRSIELRAQGRSRSVVLRDRDRAAGPGDSCPLPSPPLCTPPPSLLALAASAVTLSSLIW